MAYVNLLFVKHTYEQDLSYTGDITDKVFKKSPFKMVVSNKYKIVYFINNADIMRITDPGKPGLFHKHLVISNPFILIVSITVLA